MKGYKLIDANDQVIAPGQTITSRQDPRSTATYKYITQAPNHGSTGKIYVNYGPGNDRELYPTVFGLRIVED